MIETKIGKSQIQDDIFMYIIIHIHTSGLPFIIKKCEDKKVPHQFPPRTTVKYLERIRIFKLSSRDLPDVTALNSTSRIIMYLFLYTVIRVNYR